MKGTKVAIRYAKSLLELAIEKNAVDQVAGDMNFLAETMQNRDFQLLLSSPIVKADKKITIFREIFGQFEELTNAFIELITKNGREIFLPEIASAFEKQVKEHKGIVPVTLVSATPLESDTKSAILSKLDASVNGTLELTEIIDPALIGGFIIKMGDKQIDSSVSSQMNRLKQRLMN